MHRFSLFMQVEADVKLIPTAVQTQVVELVWMAFANVQRAGQAQVVWHEWRELLSAVTPWS